MLKTVRLVLMVFRNDYAVRMLAASVPAGIEAPLRLYVTEDANGKAGQVVAAKRSAIERLLTTHQLS